jgi:hypothetical protein
LFHHGVRQLACLATLVEYIVHKVFLLSTIPNTPAEDPDVRTEGDEVRLTFSLGFLENMARDFEDLIGIIFAVIRICTCVLWQEEQEYIEQQSDKYRAESNDT